MRLAAIDNELIAGGNGRRCDGVWINAAGLTKRKCDVYLTTGNGRQQSLFLFATT